MKPQPYKSTRIFDEKTLPEALRSEHRTKTGTWGLLRVLEGRVKLVFIEPHREVTVGPDRPAVIPPQDVHFVVAETPMRMQVDFFHELPTADHLGPKQVHGREMTRSS